MAYDPEFFRRYGAYLQEPGVRSSHDFVFGCFRRFVRLAELRVLDFGCGLGEYWRHGHPLFYAGIDLNDAGHVENFFREDYHDLRRISELPFPFVPTAFVSLFSTECCPSVAEKYDLYRRIFSLFPYINFGLVSGFFYESKRNLEMVEETGGNVSYQTIEDPAKYIFPEFSEFRMHIRTPSKMFGQDVIEVWKILCRR